MFKDRFKFCTKVTKENKFPNNLYTHNTHLRKTTFTTCLHSIRYVQ